MSSSHLFLGLPKDLLVLYFELSSGFHFAALINHLSFCDVAILIASLHFIVFVSLVPASYLLISHLFYSFNGAPFNVFDPFFFFDLRSVNFFIIVNLE